MEASEADRLTPIAETALLLVKQIMEATHSLSYHREARGFGFGYSADQDVPVIRIAVDWHGKRVLQITVNTAPACVRPWSIQPFDNGGDDSWIDVMRGAVEGLQLAQLPAQSAALH